MNLYRIALFLSLAATACGGTNGFTIPAFRGSPNSQAGYWETFSAAVGAPGNPADKAGATTDAVLMQTNSTAFLTGSGNIYNLDGTSFFLLSNATPFALGTVVLQTRTLGTELDYASVWLLYQDGLGVHSLKPIARQELNRGEQPGLGATVSSLWQWDLGGLGVSNYQLSFRAAGNSTSFDSMTLDTAAQFTPVWPQPFAFTSATPSLERWMYANNAAPCDRPAGSVFAEFGDDSGVDTRIAQHLVGWDTASLVPTNRGPARYLVRRCRVTLTINRGNLFFYDPTPDDYRTYFETNEAQYRPDADAGRPLELFGVGFRNGFDAATFDQCAPFGSSEVGQRNAFAAGGSPKGTLVDVSNNVGKTNESYPRFEVAAFAIGQTTNAAPGQLVPPGSLIAFDLNLQDPLVLAYLQSALHTGRLRLMVSALLSTDGPAGQPRYPDFATHFNEAIVDPTRLEWDGVAVRDLDADSDGLPDDWENFYFGNLSAGAADDPDLDGQGNLDEFRAGTDPTRTTSSLRILALSGNSNGNVALQSSWAASRNYRAEFTENLSTWSPMTNAPMFSLGTNVMTWTDHAPHPVQRTYRVRAEVP